MSIFTGLITAEIKQLHHDSILEAVRAASVPCTIIFGGSKFTDCPNCIFDPAANKSSGRFQNGGTQPFSGVCPICFGAGKLTVQTTETINLAVIYDYKDWIKLAPNINNPNGIIQTISPQDTIVSLKKAKELIVNTTFQTDTQITQKYERFNEPDTCGFGQVTIVHMLWKRIES